MATLQTTINVAAKDGTFAGLASVSKNFRKLAEQVGAISSGKNIAGIVSTPVAAGLATMAKGVRKFSSGFRASISEAAHAGAVAMAPLALAMHAVAENIKEIEDAKQGLQKSFLIKDPNDKSNHDVKEYDSLVNKSRDLSMNSIYGMQDYIKLSNELRSRNLSTDQVSGSMETMATLASIKNEDLKETAERVLSIQRGFFGMTNSASLFDKELNSVANTTSVMAKRLGLNYEQMESFSKNAAPIARLMVHSQIASIEEAMKGASGSDLAALEDQFVKVYSGAMNGAFTRLAALTQAGFTPEESGNAFKSIGTRAAMPTSKALMLMQRSGIDPLAFQSVNPNLFTGAGAASMLAGQFGGGMAKYAPDFQKAIDQHQGDWFGARQAMLDKLTKSGAFKRATDAKKAAGILDLFQGSSVSAISFDRLEKEFAKHNVTPGVRKELSGMYHLSKFADLTPNAVAQEAATLNGELAKSGERLAVLKQISEQGLPGAFKLLRSSFTSLSDAMGSAVKDDVVDGLTTIRDGMRGVYKLATQHPDAFRPLAKGLLAFVIAVPAILFINSLVTALGALISLPVLGFVAGMWGVYSILSKVDQIGPRLSRTFDHLKQAFAALNGGNLSKMREELRALVGELRSIPLGDAWSKLSGGEKIAAIVGGLWALARVVRVIAAGFRVLAAAGRVAFVGVAILAGIARPVAAGLRLLPGLFAAGAIGARIFGGAMRLAGAGLRFLIGPVNLIISAVVGLAFHWQELVASMSAGWDLLKGGAADFGAAVAALFNGDFGGAWERYKDSVVKTFEGLSTVVVGIVRTLIEGFVDSLGGDGAAVWGSFASAAVSALDSVIGAVKSAVAWVRDLIAALASIPGAPAPLDPNPLNRGGFFKPDDYEYLPDGSRKKKLSSFSEQGLYSPGAMRSSGAAPQDVNVAGSADINVTVKVDAPKGLNATGTASAATVPLKRGTNFA